MTKPHQKISTFWKFNDLIILPIIWNIIVSLSKMRNPKLRELSNCQSHKIYLRSTLMSFWFHTCELPTSTMKLPWVNDSESYYPHLSSLLLERYCPRGTGINADGKGNIRRKDVPQFFHTILNKCYCWWILQKQHFGQVHMNVALFRLFDNQSFS